MPVFVCSKKIMDSVSSIASEDCYSTASIIYIMQGTRT